MNSQLNEKLLNEQTLWTFDRDDFKSAITCWILDDEDEMETTMLQMKELISKHFENDKQLIDWSKDIYKQVTIIFQRINISIWLQHAASIQRGCLYVSIVAEIKIRNGLSGKYNFHSMKDNKPAFIREGGKISGLSGENHYLAFYEEKKSWYIQTDDYFLKGEGGFLKNISSGKYVLDSLYC